MADSGWDEAMAGCHGVAHVASPFPLGSPKHPDDVVRPALEGTVRVLEAALRVGVGRFVQTSSLVAVMYGHPHDRTRPFDEDDWTDLDAPSVTPYQRSKTLAERAARQIAERAGARLHFSTVNPGLIMGPPAHSDVGTSVEIVRMILAGKYPGMPRVMALVADVRDVARAHVLAMQTAEPSGGRYLICDRAIWLIEFGSALRAALGEAARKAPRRQLPDWLVRTVALFHPKLREIVPELGRDIVVHTSRTRRALGIERFIPAEEAVVATGRALVERGLG